MSSVRQFTGKITNPLRNADPAIHANASEVYTEERAYGPVIPLDQPGGSTSDFFDYHRWAVDPAADAAAGDTYRQVQAVFDGDLYIDEILDDSVPDEDKLVRLALGVSMLTATPLPRQLSESGVTRTPVCAFYGNVRYDSLEKAMAGLDYKGPALAKFCDLGALQPAPGTPKVVHVLPVFAGEVIGELGDVTLDSGAAARALDFWLTEDRGGGVLYPDALYADIVLLASHRMLHYEDLDSPNLERHSELSIWSVCSPRVVLRSNDEWNQPLGRNRAAALTLVRDDGERLDWEYPPLRDGQSPNAMAALTGWAANHETAALEARSYGVPATPLLLSTVPSGTAAAESVTVALTTPAEVTIQALDPADWFPEQGGKGWDPEGGRVVGGEPEGAHTTVTLPAPHAVARWTNGNTVTPLVDGHAYFTDLAAELDGVTAQTHFVCQAGWWFDHTFPLTQTYDPHRDPASPVGADARTLGPRDSGSEVPHWQRIASVGAPLFLLAWDPTGGPYELLTEALPAGGIRNLWSSISDYGGAALSFATALVNTEAVGALYNPNSAAVAALNNLTGTGPHEAILDGRTRPAASHHAKMAAILNDRGLVAYVGGIDLNADRPNSTAHYDYLGGTGPYHDVQCRVEGPAARDVLRTFLSRWNDHPQLDEPDQYNGKTGELSCTALGITGGIHQLLLEPEADRMGGTNLVQIARTFGNCRGLDRGQIHQNGDFASDTGYTFAPDGDFTIEAAVVGAIRRAKRYVYIEDQFLGSMKIATVLADKIAERKAAREKDSHEEPFFVYILVPRFPNAANAGNTLVPSDFPYELMRRYAQFRDGTSPAGPSLAGRVLDLLAEQEVELDQLQLRKVDPWGYLQTRWYELLTSIDPAGKCWGMHCLRLPPYQHWLYLVDHPDLVMLRKPGLADRRIYIHSKVTIVDDVWATIGSANVNVRSYTGDTEINCNFIDGRTDERGLRVSVRDLRRQLWADHLDMALESVPLAPGNHPDVMRFWTEHTAPATGDPASASDELPTGSRVYRWPYREVEVGLADPPGFSWSLGDLPVEVTDYGIKEVPMYWWAIEGYGKAPWPPDNPETDTMKDADVATLMPPQIGSERFAFDRPPDVPASPGGDTYDGAQYTAFDLRPHPRDDEGVP